MLCRGFGADAVALVSARVAPGTDAIGIAKVRHDQFLPKLRNVLCTVSFSRGQGFRFTKACHSASAAMAKVIAARERSKALSRSRSPSVS